jgi:hypothetical protein
LWLLLEHMRKWLIKCNLLLVNLYFGSQNRHTIFK